MDYYSQQNQISARKNNTYSKVMDSLTKCPFCDLKKKYIVKRLSGMYLTVNLFPHVDGHLLIVSQRHIETFSDLTRKEWGAALELIKHAKKLYKSRLEIRDFAVLCHEGGNSGRSLKHFHISLIPDGIVKSKYQTITLPPLELTEKLR